MDVKEFVAGMPNVKLLVTLQIVYALLVLLVIHLLNAIYLYVRCSLLICLQHINYYFYSVSHRKSITVSTLTMRYKCNL